MRRLLNHEKWPVVGPGHVREDDDTIALGDRPHNIEPKVREGVEQTADRSGDCGVRREPIDRVRIVRVDDAVDQVEDSRSSLVRSHGTEG